MTVRRRDAAATRAEILAAARVRFGADGYDRVTLRAIAQDVGVDPALAIRYFGSKEGLFAEVSEVDLHLPDLTGLPRERVPEVLLPHFFALWEAGGFLPLLRAAAGSDAAAATMRRMFARQVGPGLGAAAVDQPARRAALLGSHLLGIVFSRYLLRTPPLVEMSDDELVKAIGPVVQRYLFDPLD